MRLHSSPTSLPGCFLLRVLLLAAFSCLALVPSKAVLAADNKAAGSEAAGSHVLPPSERLLKLVDARPWHKASDDGRTLEGAVFDRAGNLLFCDNTTRRIVQVSKDGSEKTLVDVPSHAPGGLAFGPDGRLYICAIDMDRDEGVILALAEDGSLETIIGPEKGFWPNDMVFDKEGGFYFTDFRGSAFDPKGSVCYVSPDFATVTPFLTGLSQANGVGLSPDGKTLWVTEFAKGILYRVDLTGPTSHSPVGANVAYRFQGPAPDSLRVDSEGNVYVAIYTQGRWLAFNPQGTPVMSIQAPGREKGDNLLATSLAVDPNEPRLYLVAGNLPGGAGSHVFTCEALARGQAPTR